MPGLKTNEREGTRAVLRHARLSPYKVREVLDLVRGKPVHEAEDILRFSERDAASVVLKVLHSAVANAENNDDLEPEELFVSACFADEGTTIKRWRPRARGRATRIRKRTSHITLIVSRMPDQQLQRLQARRRAEQLAQRARRVAGARQAQGDQRSRAERRHGGPVTEELLAEEEAPTADAGAEETAEPAAESAEAEAAAEPEGTLEGAGSAGPAGAGDGEDAEEQPADEPGAGDTIETVAGEGPATTGEDEAAVDASGSEPRHDEGDER